MALLEEKQNTAFRLSDGNAANASRRGSIGQRQFLPAASPLLLANRLVCGTISGMLLPQFSIRWILVLTAAFAVVSLLTTAALNDVFWARAVLIGLASLVSALATYALLFLAVYLGTGGRITSEAEPSLPRPPQPVSMRVTKGTE